MAVCTEATRGELDGVLSSLKALPEVVELRPPELGLVMLRGRMGGDGRQFNLGEASVTRAVVSLADGRTGFAYQLGRDCEKARTAALVDALWQGFERPAIEQALEPIRARIASATALRARRVAATRVNFFTMARGED